MSPSYFHKYFNFFVKIIQYQNIFLPRNFLFSTHSILDWPKFPEYCHYCYKIFYATAFLKKIWYYQTISRWYLFWINSVNIFIYWVRNDVLALVISMVNFQVFLPALSEIQFQLLIQWPNNTKSYRLKHRGGHYHSAFFSKTSMNESKLYHLRPKIY